MPEKDDKFGDDKPMTEAEWEAFMKRADVRAAKFGELLETLIDDPDRHMKIDREMGWDRARENQDPEVREMIEEHEECARELEENPDAGADFFEAMDSEVEAIPAYQICEALGTELQKSLKRYLNKPVNKNDDEISRLLGIAALGPFVASVKISGGHAMGTDEDSIGGNVVNCKRGLEGIREGREAMVELMKLKALPANLVEKYLPRIDEAIASVESHITSLRNRM